MGRINTTYSFRDRASPAISNVTQRMMVLSKRLNETRKSTLQVNVVMKDLVQSSIQTSVNITKLTSQVTRLTNSVKRLVTELDNSDSKLNKPFRGMIGSMGKASIALMGLESGFQLLGRTIAGIKSVGNFLNTFIKDASDYEAMLTNLSVAFGGVAESQDMFKRLQEFASQTPFTLPQAVKAATTFKSVGIETKKIIPTLALLGDLAKGNNEAFNHMALNYSQILSRGFANQRDLNEFSTWGVSVTKTLKDMGVDGVASAQAVTNALIKLTSEGQPFFQSMVSNAKTYSGILAQMKDSYQRLSADIGDYMLPSAKSSVRIFDRFFENLRNNPSFFISLDLPNLTEMFDQNLNQLVGIIGFCSVIAVLAGTIALIVAGIVATVGIIPILIVSSIIILLKVISDWLIQIQEENGEIVGVVRYFGAILGGIIGLVVSLAKLVGVTVYNAFASILGVAVDILNIFTGASLENALLGLANLFLRIISPIVTVIDWLFHTDFVSAIKDTIKDNEVFMKFNTEENGGMFFKSPELKDVDSVWSDVSNAGKTGYEFGKSFDMAFGDIEKSIKNFNDLKEEPFKTDGQGNLMVNDVNSIKLADDFRDLLLEQARMRFQTYINTVTPNINVGDVHFEEKVDMNEFVDKLTDSAMRISQSELSVAYG